MPHIFLFNVLLILAGPFLVIGAQAVVAELGWHGRGGRPRRTVRRPAAGWAVASWA